MVRVAVVGCGHGDLDEIYASLDETLKREAASSGDSEIRPVDLLLVCGDFEASRSLADLSTMAVPPKYQRMNSFHHYYKGDRTAPVLTIFIGGNHEASAHMQELPYGGWVAPRMYYLGYAGVVWYKGLRIGGLSGIYNERDYHKGRFESVPYDRDSLRTVFHVRRLDVERLAHLGAADPLDVFLSHDWPHRITRHGDARSLIRSKPYFEEEIRTDTLGSPAATHLLETLQPRAWFAAHLHVKFAAVVPHRAPPPPADPAELDLDEAPPAATRTTRFLALDKVGARREFLQLLELPSALAESHPFFQGAREDDELRYDPDWLGILAGTHELTPTHAHCTAAHRASPRVFPVADAVLSASREEWRERAKANPASFVIPRNFQRSDACAWGGDARQPPRRLGNPQTDALYAFLGGLRHVPGACTVPCAPAEAPASHEAAAGTESV